MTQTRLREAGWTDFGAIAAVRKVCLAPTDQKLPWEIKHWRVFIFTLFLREWGFHKWFISFLGYWHFWHAVQIREREREMVLLLIPCALRLVRLNKLHGVSVSRTFHLRTWALECTNTACYLRFTVWGSCGSFMLCSQAFSWKPDQCPVTGPACVCSVFLPTSLTLAC